jgi:hypothetical protein
MKIELNTLEATDLFTQLAQVSKVNELEAELATLRIDLENAHASRRDAWARNDRLESETYELRQNNENMRREVASIKREIQDMIDRATPNYKERQVSKMFALYRSGQTIYAIKAVRTLLNLGLKEAKEIVEGTFQNGNMLPAFDLCQVFKGIKSGRPIDELRTELVKTGLVDALVGSAGGLAGGEQLTNDLNRILHGEFHDGANIEF